MRIKTIFASVSAVVVVIAMFGIAIWVSHLPKEMACERMEIQISDSAKHAFVSVDELYRTLNRNGLSPVGKKIDDISCQKIEDCLLQHDMIRTAQCFIHNDGTVRVRVTQRVPLLYVVGAEGAYYVDTDRKIMPTRSTIKVDVPMFRGAVSPRAATEEYYDFVCWLKDDHYWSTRIARVHVRTPKDIVLVQNEVEGTIVLGELEGYEQKLSKLRKLYVSGFDVIGYKPYKEYDLRFEGQVVGRY